MRYHPLTVTAIETNPESVAKYNVQIREEDGTSLLVENLNVDADPSGTTVLKLGETGGFITPNLVGRSITVYVQQVGPAGDLSDYSPAGDSEGHGGFTVTEIPDGAESLVVNT